MKKTGQNKFSKAEIRCITESNLLFIRISGAEAHVTSPKTLDDWIICKQPGYVILYHRHPDVFSFHEHRRFRFVRSAIDEICSHDVYTIARHNELVKVVTSYQSIEEVRENS